MIDFRTLDDFERQLIGLAMDALADEDTGRAITFGKAWEEYRERKPKPAPRRRKADDPNEARGILKGASSSGKTPDFGSGDAGSTPAAPAKTGEEE